MDNKKLLRRSLKLLGIFLLIILIIVVFTFIVIYMTVRDSCNKAMDEYGEDCITSQMMILDDPDKSYREKNVAIYTLGQIADDRSLNKLKTLYSYEKPAVEPLDETISQYELEKAIRWTEEGSATSWMYFQFK